MIIAEISQNFTTLAEAKELVRLARENAADLAKAQLFDSTKLYKEKSPAELSFEDARDLFEYGRHIGIEVFFSVFDVERVKWCEEIGVKRYKVAYSQRNNKDLIFEVQATGKLIYISTSYAPAGYVRDGNYQIFYLYCVPRYPTELNDVLLSAIDFPWTFQGFSDHTVGIDCAKIALARGCEILEKHFCIDHNTGIDAPWSMDSSELGELVRWQRVCKEAL